MAKDKQSDNGSAKSPENGGKKYLQDKKWLEDSIEKHGKDIGNLQTEVSEINTKVSVLDEIKDLSRQTNETVIRMDEKQGSFVTKEKYLEDKVSDAKVEMAEVSGVHQMPAGSKDGGWKKTHTIISVITGVVVLLSALGLTIGFKQPEEKPLEKAAKIMAVKNAMEGPKSDMSELLKQQKEFMENMNKIMDAHHKKVNESLANGRDKVEIPDG